MSENLGFVDCTTWQNGCMIKMTTIWLKMVQANEERRNEMKLANQQPSERNEERKNRPL